MSQDQQQMTFMMMPQPHQKNQASSSSNPTSSNPTNPNATNNQYFMPPMMMSNTNEPKVLYNSYQPYGGGNYSSKVVMMQNLKPQVTKDQIFDVCSEEGHITHLLLEPEKRSALLQFDSTHSAKKFVEQYGNQSNESMEVNFATYQSLPDSTRLTNNNTAATPPPTTNTPLNFSNGHQPFNNNKTTTNANNNNNRNNDQFPMNPLSMMDRSFDLSTPPFMIPHPHHHHHHQQQPHPHHPPPHSGMYDNMYSQQNLPMNYGMIPTQPSTTPPSTTSSNSPSSYGIPPSEANSTPTNSEILSTTSNERHSLDQAISGSRFSLSSNASTSTTTSSSSSSSSTNNPLLVEDVSKPASTTSSPIVVQESTTQQQPSSPVHTPPSTTSSSSSSSSSTKRNKHVYDPNHILLVTFEDVIRRDVINCDFVKRCFSKFGRIEKVICVKRQSPKSFVQFHPDDLSGAVHAKTTLDGTKLPNSQIRLTIQYSKRSELSINANNEFTCDYTMDSKSLKRSFSSSSKDDKRGGRHPVRHRNQRGVLLVTGFNSNKMTPQKLFNLFSCYGFVEQVKVFFQKRDHAFVQYANMTQANHAVDILSKCTFYGNSIHVTRSKQDFLRDADDIPVSLNRFSRNFAMQRSKNKGPRMCQPTNTVHVTNLPQQATKKSMQALFSSYGSILALKFFNHDNIPMCLIRYETVEQAIEAICEVHNTPSTDKKFYKVSFSTNTQF